MSKALTWGLGTVWLALILSGTFVLMVYANTPGKLSAPPKNWPSSSPLLPSRERSTVLMFVHPQCPCSSASVGELAVLMAHCQGRVDAHVFFLRPSGATTQWVQTSLWQDAKRIPGVTVHYDDNGQEARRFGASTSGDTLLYDPAGHLLFHGGITSARGHSGDNAGRDAVEALLFDKPTSQTSAPVFGCSIFECPAATAH